MTLLRTVPTQPFADQKLFPSGLRKPPAVFRQPHYLENAVHSFFTIFPNRQGQTLVLGGDGQDITQGFLQIII
jgi:phosphoglucomutase